MTFSISRNILLTALQTISKVIPLRTTLPIISCALFTQKNKKLNIRATDLEISMNLNCDIESSNEGSIAIPLNKLLEITNAMPEGEIHFDISDIGKVSINCNQGQYTIMGQSIEEYPVEFAVENGTTFTIEGSELINIINNISYAVSHDDLKPVLQGVLFQIGERGLISVATDGHRLVKVEKNNVHAIDYKGSVVVPIKFLKLLNNQINEDSQISMIIGDNHIEIEIPNGKIISRIIKDSYPDYNGVIPKDNTKTLIIDKNSFTEAIKRVSIFSNKSSKQVALNISENNLIITTEDSENITSGKETLDCNYDGDPMTIGYNALYLKEVLQHQNSTEIKILLNTPLNAGLFLPMEQKNNENKTTLLMPIRLND